MQAFHTPILFLVFNRPDTTQQVFDVLRKIKPTKLFIAADGPRLDKDAEKEKCIAVRRIATQIDWECQLVTLFRDKNLGCGKAVSEAITWFFSHVEEGIILEDDCLPCSSFFLFCSELLERYRDNEKIAHISANNFQMGVQRGNSDYYFSRYTHVWGWATWGRAWNDYDYKMAEYEKLKKNYPHKKLLPFGMMNAVKYESLDTWDVQWMYTNFLKDRLSIMPNINLVQNIGFTDDATHTRASIPDYIKYSHSGELYFPLKHPVNIKANNKADLFSAKTNFNINTIGFTQKIYRKLKSVLSKIYHYKLLGHEL